MHIFYPARFPYQQYSRRLVITLEQPTCTYIFWYLKRFFCTPWIELPYYVCLLYPVPLSPCQDRVKRGSGGKLALWNYVPYCSPDGGFQDVQCNAHTGNCWCVNINGLEFTETQSKKIPNCVTPGKLINLWCKIFRCFSFKSRLT